MPNLYIISGCNGAGKTTASYTILPEILNCREFVNADNIAAGLSPFNPESVAVVAGRTMLNRIQELLSEQADFALETTLSTRSYVSLIKQAHSLGYKVRLLYFWLSSPSVAIKRVAQRVSESGHHIPSEIIIRRYNRGLYNLYNLYMPICEEWTLVDNMNPVPKLIAKSDGFGKTVFSNELWDSIKEVYMNNTSGINQDATFTEKVMFGLKISSRKMVEEAALHNRSLVIGDKDGNAKLVPAKELLKTLPK